MYTAKSEIQVKLPSVEKKSSHMQPDQEERS